MAEGRATYKIDVDTRGAQASLDGVVKGALPKFEKLSGSINAAASQIGGLGGVVGKTLGTFKQFGEAFMVGGPFGVGLAAGVVAVGYLINKFGEGERAVQKFRDANREAMADFLGDVEQAAADAEERLAAFGKTADRMRAERASMLVFSAAEVSDDAATRRKELMKDEEKLALMSRISHADRMRMSIGDQQRFHAELKSLKNGQEARLEYIEGLKETEKNADKAAAAHIRERDALNELVNKQDEKVRSDKARIAAEREEAEFWSNFDQARANTMKGVDGGLAEQPRLKMSKGGFGEEPVSPLIAFDPDEEAAMQRRAEKHSEMMETISKNERKFVDEEAEYRRAVEFALREERIKGNQWIVETMKDALLEYVQFSQSVIMQSFDLTLDAIETIAAGQEVSLESMAAGFVKSIGRQLVAIGLTQTFEGTGHIIRGGISGDPRAIAGGLGLVALGTTAMSVGGAMAVTGAVASGMISGAAGGGGGGGGSGSSTMRPSRREGIGGGDDGGRSVTIVYNGGTFLGDSRQHERDRRRHMSNVFVPGVA